MFLKASSVYLKITLGVVEMLNMIGRFVATIGLVLFPPNKLKLTYFIFVII